jgi:hypothetical protein
MPDILGAEVVATRFIGETPAGGVVAALDAVGAVVNLLSWNPATGDMSYNAPAGSDAGGGSRTHFFNGTVVANKATGARLVLGTSSVNGSIAAPLEPGVEFRGYLDKVQARITGVEEHSDHTTGGLRFYGRTNLNAVEALGQWNYLALNVQSASGFAIGALPGRRRITGAASEFGIIGDDNGFADVRLRHSHHSGSAHAAAYNWTDSTALLTRTALNGYVLVHDASGNGALMLGGSSDQRTYYNNNAHYFRTVGGAATLAWLDTPDAGYGAFVLYFNESGTLVPKRVRMDAAAGGKRTLYVDA